MDRVPTETHETPRRDDPTVTAGWRLKHRRGELGWTQLILANRFQATGALYHGSPKPSSLVSMISKWENDDIVPDSYNLHILAEALGVQVGELGFPVDPHYVHPARRKTPLPLD